jgi:diaminopimelate decarboxylase
VDAGMNDLIRPSLYNAVHRISPVVENSGRTIVADIVGPVCETGDFLGKDREIQCMESGDLLAVFSAGAYGFSMSSNYNSRPRPAEVLVYNKTAKLICKRETRRDLVRNEL